MGLAEAMACGLPAVAFDLPSGPRDIIREGIDGVLTPVNDVPAFANALSSLIADPSRRSVMAGRAPEVLDRFGVDTIMTRWEDLIASVRGDQ
jgi:glycosyltransferase involved in cell wall biosynthesis